MFGDGLADGYTDGFNEGYNGCGLFDADSNKGSGDYDKGYNYGFDVGYNKGWDLREEHGLEND
jgi:hypothetical protein